MSMVSFMPWFTIQAPQVVSGVELFPYPATRGMTLAYPAEVQVILRNYQEKNGIPIRNATIFKMATKGITDDLTNSEIEQLHKLRNAMSISGISTRRLASHDYVNSDTFELITQKYIQVPIQDVSIVTRMRGGTMSNIFPIAMFRASCPEHVSAKRNFAFDFDFAKSVFAAIDAATVPHGTWKRIEDSVEGLNLANTDHGRISYFSEFVLTCGAFERLLKCNGKLAAFRAKVCGELKSIPTQPIAGCQRTLPNLVSGPGLNISDAYYAFVGCTTLREVWATDFYKLRNKYAHGDRGPSYQPIWSTEEHLSLAAFLFPLLLKIKLVKLGLYTMSTIDLANFWSFDFLLCEQDLLTPEAQNDTGWSNAKMAGVMSGPPLNMTVP